MYQPTDLMIIYWKIPRKSNNYIFLYWTSMPPQDNLTKVKRFVVSAPWISVQNVMAIHTVVLTLQYYWQQAVCQSHVGYSAVCLLCLSFPHQLLSIKHWHAPPVGWDAKMHLRYFPKDLFFLFLIIKTINNTFEKHVDIILDYKKGLLNVISDLSAKGCLVQTTVNSELQK